MKTSRKCRRCKCTFEKNGIKTICSDCSTKCASCGSELNENTWDKSAKERNQYKCKNCVAEVVRRTRCKVKQREYDLQRHYKISNEDYNRMLEEQQHECAICGITIKLHGKRFHVDHNHITGSIRGLLCGPCNVAIGLLKDDADVCYNAYEYLRGHNG